MKFAIFENENVCNPGKMMVDRYCLRHSTCRSGCNGSSLRNWQLQGSNDGDLWTTLRAHKNDEALAKTKYSTASWAVEGGKGAFAQFRVLQTGKNGGGHSRDRLYCAGIELYGTFFPEEALVSSEEDEENEDEGDEEDEDEEDEFSLYATVPQ
jgi:hypothetical protein